MKYNILLVDDEEQIVKALVRRIRVLHPEWEIHMARSGQEGLEILDRTPCEIVVTDLLMPVMDGATFLSKVRERFPKMVRFALSGHAQQDLMLQAISLSHQYFSKPCDTVAFVSAIEESLRHSFSIHEQKLKEIIIHLNQFPLLPSVHNDLVNALNDSQKGFDLIANIVAKDPSLASKIMQVANSSFYGVPRHVSDLQEATALLGTQTIHAIALMFKFFENFRNPKTIAISQENLYTHSISVAKIAAAIIEHRFQKPELVPLVCTVGLLHDLGKLILADYSPGQYQSVMEVSKANSLVIWKLEEEAFGVSHAEVGSMLFKLWGLPQSFCNLIRWHHQPSEYPDALNTEVLSALHIADVMEYDLHPQDEFYASQFDLKYLTKKGLPASKEYWTSWLKDYV